MATLTFQDVEGLANRSRPWTFRLTGGNQDWIFSGRARHEPVEVTFNSLDPYRSDFATAQKHVALLLSQGLAYAATPFRRVSQTVIDEWLAEQAPTGLTGPYAHITSVRPGRPFWTCLDAKGNSVMNVPLQGARDLVRKYPHIKVEGLA